MTIGRVGAEAHDLIRGHQGPPLEMFAGARGATTGPGAEAGLGGLAAGPVADGELAEGIAEVFGGVVVGGAEELLGGIGEEALPAGIDGFELGEVLHEEPELGAVAAEHGDVVGKADHAAELAKLVQEEGDAVGRLPLDCRHGVERQGR